MAGFFVGSLLFALLIVVLARIYQKRLRNYLSLEWPLIPATFEGGQVEQIDTLDDVYYRMSINFQYKVDEFGFRGSYREEFPIAEDADKMLRSLKNGPLLVRYNPANPADYLIDPYRDVRIPS